MQVPASPDNKDIIKPRLLSMNKTIYMYMLNTPHPITFFLDTALSICFKNC